MDDGETNVAAAAVSSSEPAEANTVAPAEDSDMSTTLKTSLACDNATGDAGAMISHAEDEEKLSTEVTKLEVGSGEAAHGKNSENSEDNDAATEEGEISADTECQEATNGEQQNEDKIITDRPVQNDVAVNSDVTKVDEEYEGSEGEIVDSDDGEEGNTETMKRKTDYSGLDDVVRPELDQLDYDEDVDDGEIKSEQESKVNEPKIEDKDMSDGEIASSDGEVKSDSEEKKPSSGEMRYDDFEEGEMVDPSGRPTIPREICRFFERGTCTYGDRCRFIHPGINDKGGYRMFGDDKPQPPVVGPPMRFPPPLDPRGHPMPPNLPPPMMFGPPPPETAWERGLRHAKEMRRRAMQRKVEEPDFMRKREVLSLNEALNVDRDMDYIAHKPLADEETKVDPFNVLEEDERYAVPSLDEIKKYKRFEKSHKEGRRSPTNDMRRPSSPRDHYHRDMHDRNRDRRSPPRHPGGPPHFHDRHQPMPVSHHASPHMRHDHRDRREAGGDRGRHERDYRDRRMNDHSKERDYKMDSKDYPAMESRTSPKRRDVESRVVPVMPQSGKKKSSHSTRGDTWSDPWARGRQNLRRKASRSDSESSGSSSSSSRSSYSSRSGSSFSSRSSSRSSYSSSYSSSGSSRSPSPKKTVKKTKTKKVVATKTLQKAKDSPKPGKTHVTTAVKQQKKTADIVKAKLTKNAASKPPPKSLPPPKTTAKEIHQERGRAPVKTLPKKGIPKKKYDSSSSSEFSHSSSSESRSRSRGKGSESDSDSGSSSSSSSGSDSYTSSSSSSASSDEEVKKPKAVKKKVATKAAAAGGKKSVAKVSVPSKPGNKNVKMTINDKASVAKSSALPENRKRPAAAMTNVPTKKVSAIANRRVELLEQLKVVENAILKKRAKLT